MIWHSRLAPAALAAVIIATIQIGWAAPASAEHCFEVERSHFSHGQLITTVVLVCPDHSAPGDGPSEVAAPPPAGSAACEIAAEMLGLSAEELCSQSDPVLPVVTDGLVARAFRQLQLPTSTLKVQPPGGRTLVNFATNFFTTNDQVVVRTVRLLGRRIELRIWPSSYTWHFDDGDPLTTTSPGARFPDLDVTHDYLEKGLYHPAVDTTYAAEWRAGDNSWRPVNGTATISGTPVDLRAIEARPTLVGYGD